VKIDLVSKFVGDAVKDGTVENRSGLLPLTAFRGSVSPAFWGHSTI